MYDPESFITEDATDATIGSFRFNGAKLFRDLCGSLCLDGGPTEIFSHGINSIK